MGPAFKRSRFGARLALLGVSCLVLIPREISGPEQEMHQELLNFFSWAILFGVGSLLALRSSPTYGKTQLFELVPAWFFIIASWYLASTQSEYGFSKVATNGVFAYIGLFAGIIVFIIGVAMAERFAGIDSESEPLSKEEEKLVRTILERRLGGG